MKFLAFALGIPLIWATVGRVAERDPFAASLIVGFMAPVLLFVVVARMASKPWPLPRKADPAKIAWMERELGIEASERPTTVERPPICDCKGVAGDCGRCDGACASMVIGGEQTRLWRARFKPRP